MDIDDSSDKVRRNVLILSFAIVAGYFLDLNFEQQGKVFGVIDLANLSQTKLWTVVTIVLVYLFLRYWFDEARQKELSSMRAEFGSFRYSRIHSALRKEVQKSILRKQQPKWVIDFKELTDTNIKDYYEKEGLPSKVDVTIHLTQNEVNKWRGELGVTYGAEWKNGKYITKSGGFNYDFKFTEIMKFKIMGISILKIFTFSKASVDFFIPIILSALAFIICLTKLFKAI